MSSDVVPDVSALAINVTIPEKLRWTDTRRGEEFTLTTLTSGSSRTSALRSRRMGGQLVAIAAHMSRSAC